MQNVRVSELRTFSKFGYGSAAVIRWVSTRTGQAAEAHLSTSVGEGV